MTVFLDRDHNAVEFADELYAKLSLNYNIEYLKSPIEKPYPIIAYNLAQKVKSTENSLGILICKTGIGMAIVANKVSGIYASNCRTVKESINFKSCNNGNVLCLGASILSIAHAAKICGTFLDTAFNVTHAGRIELINSLVE